jgi:hypothetical protein
MVPPKRRIEQDAPQNVEVLLVQEHNYCTYLHANRLLGFKAVLAKNSDNALLRL